MGSNDFSNRLKESERVLRDFHSIEPKIMLTQRETVDRLVELHQKAAGQNQEDISQMDADLLKKYFNRYAVKEDRIQFRGFEVPDLKSDCRDEDRLWKFEKSDRVGSVYGADVEVRAKFFQNRAFEVFNSFYENQSLPEQIVHVTCTGYVSPSAPQRLVAARGTNTGITHSYHMGCYAALPSVRTALGLVANNSNAKNKTDIIHTEICGLHLNPTVNTPEQIIVQTLFADGHIKYSATQSQNDGHELKVLAIREKLVQNSHLDMSWITAPWGFKMNLSREVPQKIVNDLRVFLSDLANEVGLDLSTLLKKSLFAVHPGGPRIIDEVQKSLEISNEQIAHSKKILKSRGNMSSATLPHVWQSMLDEGLEKDQIIVSLAFGPGLTIFGSVFKVS